MVSISRRNLLAAGAALPLLGLRAQAQGAGKVLRFGLSSFPPSLQPWLHTGTAALTAARMDMKREWRGHIVASAMDALGHASKSARKGR